MMPTFTVTQVDDGSEGYYELSVKDYYGKKFSIVKLKDERELLYYVLETYCDVSFEFEDRKEFE